MDFFLLQRLWDSERFRVNFLRIDKDRQRRYDRIDLAWLRGFFGDSSAILQQILFCALSQWGIFGIFTDFFFFYPWDWPRSSWIFKSIFGGSFSYVHPRSSSGFFRILNEPLTVFFFVVFFLVGQSKRMDALQRTVDNVVTKSPKQAEEE